MVEKWIKFDYDDGAEIFYKINEDETVDFKVVEDSIETKRISLFFDEIEEVYNKIAKK